MPDRFWRRSEPRVTPETPDPGHQPSAESLMPQKSRSELDEASEAPVQLYLETPILQIFKQRFPWLLLLMLLQSVSGWVVERFEGLIEQHVILAAFLTMLVGGGGNSSGQTIAELVKRLGRGELTPADLPKVLAKEVAVGALLAAGLAVGAYPRVRLLSRSATDMDALAIALSYMLIVVMANGLGVLIVMTLHRFGQAAVGSPPVAQVTVDVLGILLTCLVCTAVLGVKEGDAAAAS